MEPIFISHGSPMLLLESSATTSFLRDLGQRIGKPRAVVAITAHWTTARPAVGAAPAPATIHDFYRFPQALYQMEYPAPGAAEVAAQVARLLECGIDPGRGLDHGIWCPASLMWPKADVPIVPLSVQPRRDAPYHYRIGQAVRPLAEAGVLLLASGSLTHNLAASNGQRMDASADPLALAFADWVAAALAEGRIDALLDYRTLAPHAAYNHPTEEHLLPLFVALGASSSSRANPLHRAMQYGALAMDAYEFSQPM